ncbi:MAG TPA: response regulator [Cyclobacteriaceae bacterium]|nr:response regulator [Cyclobacteriaceae bacterium]HMV08543.1 response regulator [Cyclobacteriaceae bacterium]HMV91084.1 response regulator [Cyclobacteriaceae bacterium]HMX01316.1 response regulator [Cyclobacteriaceae bacterium]HMX51270.1 response regulator [Cyclobacteriaceae bacterium]
MVHQEVEILIVEDSMEDAELAIRALKKHNLANKIVHVTDGAQALDFLFAEGEFEGRDKKILPRVILLDLKMPKVNGLEVLEKIKADPATKSTPVVVLTSSAEDPDIKKCYALGANSYIVKPVEFGNFSKTVSDIGLYWMVMNKLP